ncbi:hypothetical protein IF2G_00711 [Cordyceps javanica]|nr:hypothetical protein IF2G_00711 [Cordyceps javanica]
MGTDVWRGSIVACSNWLRVWTRKRDGAGEVSSYSGSARAMCFAQFVMSLQDGRKSKATKPRKLGNQLE